ncbi:MAG: hypothetical protein ACQEUT_01220 [Bacillota bacterium]
MNRDPLKNLKAELDEEVFQKHKLKSRKADILKEARERMSNSQQKKSPRWAPGIAALAISLIGFLLVGPLLLEQYPRLLDTNPDEVTEPSKKKIEETPKASEIKKIYSSMWNQDKLNFGGMYLLADYWVDGKEYIIDTGVEYRGDGNISIHQQNIHDESRIILEDNIFYKRGNDMSLTLTAIPSPLAYLKEDNDSEIMTYAYYPARLPEKIAGNQYSWEIIEEGEHGIIIQGSTDNQGLSFKKFSAKIHPQTGVLLSFKGENQKGETAIEWQDRKFYYDENPLGISDSNQMFIQNDMRAEENLTPFLITLLSGENDEWKDAVGSIEVKTSRESGRILADVKLNRKIQEIEEKQIALEIAAALKESAQDEIAIARTSQFEIYFYKPHAEKAYRKAYTVSTLQQNEDQYDEDGNLKINWIDIK